MITMVKPVFKSFEVEFNGETIRINTGDKIQFVIAETGEVKKGIVNNISSKKDSFKLMITPLGATHKEVWESSTMADDSLQLEE